MQCNAVFPNYRLPNSPPDPEMQRVIKTSAAEQRSAAAPCKMFNCSSDNDSDSASDSLTSLTSSPAPRPRSQRMSYGF